MAAAGLFHAAGRDTNAFAQRLIEHGSIFTRSTIENRRFVQLIGAAIVLLALGEV